MRLPPEPAIDTSPSPGDEVKTTTCYMCACRCGIKVWLRDGRVRYIQGNPDHPVNQGVLCAKGSAGIMQHYSPARLDKPLLRVGERGSGEFREIEWDEAFQIATDWLAPIRERNPDELAFFTGRDQSQALTGWWAQQFGTINYAAHGGFCSVNMAAGGLYTLGGSFWEFGEPDWEHTKYLMLWGVAEDHDSNPIKLGLGQLKGRGAKVVAVNPVRSGYGAIADEWIGIRPGTDGLMVFALIHELLKADRIDLDYLVRYTNFVELMCPVFSRSFLQICLPTFEASFSGFGLDHIWSQLGGRVPGRIAIIDDIAVAHTRPPNKNYDVLAAIMEERSMAELYRSSKTDENYGGVIRKYAFG